MILFPCRGCAAKDAEIKRLHDLLLHAQFERHTLSRQLIEMVRTRKATGLPRHDLQPPDAGNPLPQVIVDFLDLRFERGTSLWRQQHREARKLLDAGQSEEQVIDTLSRGMVYEP